MYKLSEKRREGWKDIGITQSSPWKKDDTVPTKVALSRRLTQLHIYLPKRTEQKESNELHECQILSLQPSQKS